MLFCKHFSTTSQYKCCYVAAILAVKKIVMALIDLMTAKCLFTSI